MNRKGVLLIFVLVVCGCSSAPEYKKPSVRIPDVYKEVPGDWKVAEPEDAAIRGSWWEIFDEPELNSLEVQVDVNNQTIAASYASFLQARATIQGARAQYYPVVSVQPQITAQNQQSIRNSAVPTSSGGTFTQYSIPLDASWVPDLWGKVGSAVQADVASAQMSAADLENVKLTEHADLAAYYFELRAQDSMIDLYAAAMKAYQQTLDLTQSLYKTGINSEQAVVQAQTQLNTAQAQATNLGIARAQYEHAIATLIGKPAAVFGMPHRALNPKSPHIPVGVPSRLLERRPDVAAAERSMAAANAQIGVAKAAYYPELTLNGSAGIGGNSFAGLFSAPQFIWSLGASLAQTIFDGGARAAAVKQDEAAYEQAVANYRLAVLTAFQQVEDDIAGSRILTEELAQEEAAVAAAQKNLKIAIALYRSGIQPYLNVLTAQTTLLTNQQTLLTLQAQQLTTGVQLIEALGGGWDTGKLPSESALK
jgi:NodT family efflux transporter outer membrane factor (OMF) lipoprotein